MKLLGIVLAGGASRRFGGDKLLAPMRDGTPMLRVSVQRLMVHVDATLVVVPKGHATRRAALEGLPVLVTECDDADFGMGHTLAHAATLWQNEFGEFGDCDVALVALGDMPSIASQTYADLVSALREGASLVRPRVSGKAGHPVGFASRHREGLRMLAGDEGAKTLIAQNIADMVWVDSDDKGCLLDIDRPEDLAQIKP